MFEYVVEKRAQQLSIHIITVNGVKDNAKFRMRNSYTGTCNQISYYPNSARKLTNQNTTAIRKDNCAYGEVHLVRNLNYYVIRYYCPSFLMVVVGYLSFWIPSNAWPARIILTVSVMMTLVTVSQQGYNEVPCNDVASLYWWLWGCQFLLYMCIFEYVIALSWFNMINEKNLTKIEGLVSASCSQDCSYYHEGDHFTERS